MWLIKEDETRITPELLTWGHGWMAWSCRRTRVFLFWGVEKDRRRWLPFWICWTWGICETYQCGYSEGCEMYGFGVQKWDSSTLGSYWPKNSVRERESTARPRRELLHWLEDWVCLKGLVEREGSMKKGPEGGKRIWGCFKTRGVGSRLWGCEEVKQREDWKSLMRFPCVRVMGDLTKCSLTNRESWGWWWHR